eukprot:5445037-Pleurochrysis_carterae.AAC.1
MVLMRLSSMPQRLDAASLPDLVLGLGLGFAQARARLATKRRLCQRSGGSHSLDTVCRKTSV